MHTYEPIRTNLIIFTNVIIRIKFRKKLFLYLHISDASKLLVQKVAINDNVLLFYFISSNFSYFEFEVHIDFILSVSKMPLADLHVK